jgi:hypothetical protein
MELLKFITGYIGMFIANVLLLTISVSVTNLSPTMLQLIISPILVLVMYVVNKNIVFNYKGE